MKGNTDYALILSQLRAMTEAETDTIANLANASAVLYLNLEDVNWAGFYLVREDQLVLGPFQGRPACVRIAFGKGVCGTAVSEGAVQVVADVHAFPGHICCDSASNSEIVLPIRHGDRIVAVLDIDSPLPGRFTPEDREGLERCASFLGEACSWQI